MNGDTQLRDTEHGYSDNVDSREVAYYERLADTWWDRSGPFWPLHTLNELRTEYLRCTFSHVFSRDANQTRPLTGLTMLDIGCGGGILSESMARLGAEVKGIDIVEKNIAVARRHLRGTSLQVSYDTVDVRELKHSKATFDAVLNMEVVEHVPDVSSFIRDSAALVRPGGVLALSTINRTFRAWLFAIIGAEYILRWLPQGTHRWRQFVKPTEAKLLFDINGLDTIAETGVRVNPVNRKFSLNERMPVNYMLVARRPLLSNDTN